MKTQIFEYKGNLGATTDFENGKFINDPKAPGQLGCVIDVNEIEISENAKNLIRSANREGGSFAELMLTEHGDGGASIGLMGGVKHHFGKNFSIGRTCSLSVLDKIISTNIEAPDDYKSFIDENEK